MMVLSDTFEISFPFPVSHSAGEGLSLQSSRVDVKVDDFAPQHSFGQGAFHFSSHDELGRALIKILDKNSNILIKGSRAMKMECLIEMLMEKK